MIQTYLAIASQTLTANAGSITFSSIPQTFTDLVLIIRTRAYSNGNGSITFNGDTGLNYNRLSMGSNGTSPNGGNATGVGAIPVDFNGSNIDSSFTAANVGGTVIVNIFSYTNTSRNKTVLSQAGASALGTDRVLGLWRSNSAITSITFTGPGNLASETVAALYGIKAL